MLHSEKLSKLKPFGIYVLRSTASFLVADARSRRQQQEEDRNGAPDGDDALRHQTFTYFRKSTLSIRPTAMKNIMVADPPYEISGSGMPVTGRSPICIPTLMNT